MTTTEFEDFVAGNAKIGVEDVYYSFVGLAGETGECMEWFKKKVLRDGKQETKLTKEDLKLELGDVLHYIARIAIAYDWTLEDDIMPGNVRKLRAKKDGWV